MFSVFIDGDQGTTGLRVRERLCGREDLTLLSLPEATRKDLDARAAMARRADATILCLPDAASRELVAALGEEEGVILDASTAHRTDPRFTYGFPELGAVQAQAVKSARRIAVPGCHASGCIALVKPLIAAGLLSPDAPLSLLSLTGYSGGGKRMIADYEAPDRPGELMRVSALLAKHNGNIIKLEHNQFVNINRQNGVELKVTLEAFGQDHKQEILNGLRSEGYSVHEVKTADFYN